MPSPEEAADVARLAQLSFTPAELDRIAAELSGILAHIDVLRQVDSGSVQHGGGSEPGDGADAAATDTDALRSSTARADSLAAPPSEFAPEWRDGFFTVSRLPSHDGDRG